MEPHLPFKPSPDVAAILHHLLDIYERRALAAHGETGRRQAVRCALTELDLPGYFSQVDPLPRKVANEQLQALASAGHMQLRWLPGEQGNLLDVVTLAPERTDGLFALLERTPESVQRARLAELLLGERFRFSDWRRAAIDQCLRNVQDGKSAAPLSLTDEGFNQDLLAALAALDELPVETAYRVFSVRVFNDSKRFEDLSRALVQLARRAHRDWRGLPSAEVLRELNLVANPGHLYLSGPWQLVDDAGQLLTLGEFQPSVGVPAAQAARLARVSVDAARVVCVENATAFYEYVRHAGGRTAALCLWGNPSPACRHLLRCLAAGLPDDVPLLAWADIDYGGLRILAQLRAHVSRRFRPYRMDVETLEAHARWAQPLTRGDARNLRRLMRHAALADMRPLIEHMLARGLKLEQEAVVL